LKHIDYKTTVYCTYADIIIGDVVKPAEAYRNKAEKLASRSSTSDAKWCHLQMLKCTSMKTSDVQEAK
jgi:hypothetical protein